MILLAQYYAFCAANEKSSAGEEKQKTRGVSVIGFYDNQQHLSPSPSPLT
ncbi:MULTISPECIES: hypothetical protein [Bartonella]|nr:MULTISPECIES: hypothetical protein [Bartonella]